MPILSLMTWNHFPLPEEDIMLLLVCDPPPPPVISSSLKCQKCPEKRKQSTIMPFSLNILSRTFLSCGFCYYLYLGRYSFIFFMCLFLSVHLESGDIIFFILWRGDMKLWKGVLRIIYYYLKV